MSRETSEREPAPARPAFPLEWFVLRAVLYLTTAYGLLAMVGAALNHPEQPNAAAPVVWAVGVAGLLLTARRPNG